MASEIRKTLESSSSTVNGVGDLTNSIGARQNVGGKARFFLNVSVLSGTTPTLDVTIEAVIDGVNVTFATFTQLLAPGSQYIAPAAPFDLIPDKLQVRRAFTGTGLACTFTVTCVRY